MTNRILSCLVSIVLLLSGGAASAEPNLNPAVPPAAVINEIAGIVGREFYDREGLGAFGDSASRFRDMALSGAGLAEASNGWLATLDATHTGRFTPDQIDYYELAEVFHRGLGRRRLQLFPPEGVVTYPGIGIAPRTVGEKTFVAYVYDGGPADRAGVLAGDEILAVDGKPYAPIASFQGKAGRSSSLEIRRAPDAPPLVIAVPVETIQPRDSLMNAIRESARIIEEDGRRIGYLRLWAFAFDGVEDLVMELLASAPLEGADGLVVDMRGRWGGAPADAADIFVGRAPRVELTERDGDTHIANARWRKPVVGIIDEGSRSGMEILAHGLKRAGVPLIGVRTAGAVVAGRAFLLADNSILEVAVLDVHVDGERLEGVGVLPDIEVRQEMPYAAGADPQLDRAVAELAGMLAS